MFKSILVAVSVFLISFFILFSSVLKAASTKLDFPNGLSLAGQNGQVEKKDIDYYFVFPGKIAPDNPFWIMKAARDKIWLTLTFNKVKKAELNLLFADKRVVFAQNLFDKGKYSLAVSTLTKAEKYLEQALVLIKKADKKQSNYSEFLIKLSKASLRHRITIEEILNKSPENVRPEIVKTLDYSKNVYNEARNLLGEQRQDAPKSPFERD